MRGYKKLRTIDICCRDDRFPRVGRRSADHAGTPTTASSLQAIARVHPAVAELLDAGLYDVVDSLITPLA